MALSVTGEALRKAWRSRVVLDVDRVHAPAGSTLAVLGPSGAGKSTLLQILGLLERPDGGRVLLDGRPVDHRDRAARQAIAAVFQRPCLFQGTVADNVAYGLRLRGVPRGVRTRRVADALRLVGLGGWEGRAARTLSGGEAQRVALARALVLEPQVLLLDEPLASLDPRLKEDVAAVFQAAIRASGATVLYVTHDLDEAMALADELLVLREGRVTAAGPAAAVAVVPPDDWTAGFLGMEPPVEGVGAGTRDGCSELDCGGVRIRTTTPVAPGVSVRLGVRPEDVRLSRAGGGVPGAFGAEVHAVQPVGFGARVVVVAGGLRFAARVSRAEVSALGLAPGVPVEVSLHPEAVRVSAGPLPPRPGPGPHDA